MMIWKTPPTLHVLNDISKNSMGEHLGIEFTEFGDDFMTASMPVDHRTVQPFRILHGGASVALAETLGSVASECVFRICRNIKPLASKSMQITSARHEKAVLCTVLCARFA